MKDVDTTKPLDAPKAERNRADRKLQNSIEESRPPQVETSTFELLQKSEERFRSIVQTASDTIISVDRHGIIIFWNSAAEIMFGYSADEIVDRPVTLLMPERFHEAHQEEMKRVASTGALNNIKNTVEAAGLRKDGTEFPVELSLSCWRTKEGVFFTGIVRDITERKRAERELSESASRIKTLNDQILNMLMVVSHDIRSPLLSMAATLKLLNKGVYGKIDESVKSTLHDMYGRVKKLLGTAEDCLGKTSVVSGDVNIERNILDLRADIIDPVLDELSGEIGDQEILIDNRLGAIPANQITLKANRIWLKIVFRNLLRNAIKYGGKGCTIAFGFESNGSSYKLNVFNSGESIPETCRDRLFSKFCRIRENSKGKSEGMGLGLYLVREIIQKHGGDMWYEAKKDGSNFVFTLPHD